MIIHETRQILVIVLAVIVAGATIINARFVIGFIRFKKGYVDPAVVVHYCDYLQTVKAGHPVLYIFTVLLLCFAVGIFVSALTVYTIRNSKRLLSSFGINQERLSLVSRLQLRHSVFVSQVLLSVFSYISQ